MDISPPCSSFLRRTTRTFDCARLTASARCRSTYGRSNTAPQKSRMLLPHALDDEIGRYPTPSIEQASRNTREVVAFDLWLADDGALHRHSCTQPFERLQVRSQVVEEISGPALPRAYEAHSFEPLGESSSRLFHSRPPECSTSASASQARRASRAQTNASGRTACSWSSVAVPSATHAPQRICRARVRSHPRVASLAEPASSADQRILHTGKSIENIKTHQTSAVIFAVHTPNSI